MAVSELCLGNGVKISRGVVSQDAQFYFTDEHLTAMRLKNCSKATDKAQQRRERGFEAVSHVEQTVTTMGRLNKEVRTFGSADVAFFLPMPTGKATSREIALLRTELDYNGVTSAWEIAERG